MALSGLGPVCPAPGLRTLPLRPLTSPEVPRALFCVPAVRPRRPIHGRAHSPSCTHRTHARSRTHPYSPSTSPAQLGARLLSPGTAAALCCGAVLGAPECLTASLCSPPIPPTKMLPSVTTEDVPRRGQDHPRVSASDARMPPPWREHASRGPCIQHPPTLAQASWSPVHLPGCRLSPEAVPPPRPPRHLPSLLLAPGPAPGRAGEGAGGRRRQAGFSSRLAPGSWKRQAWIQSSAD